MNYHFDQYRLQGSTLSVSLYESKSQNIKVVNYLINFFFFEMLSRLFRLKRYALDVLGTERIQFSYPKHECN